jgi:hypothetical protein
MSSDVYNVVECHMSYNVLYCHQISTKQPGSQHLHEPRLHPLGAAPHLNKLPSHGEMVTPPIPMAGPSLCTFAGGLSGNVTSKSYLKFPSISYPVHVPAQSTQMLYALAHTWKERENCIGASHLGCEHYCLLLLIIVVNYYYHHHHHYCYYFIITMLS